MTTIIALTLSLTATGLASLLLALRIKKERKRRWYDQQLAPTSRLAS